MPKKTYLEPITDLFALRNNEQIACYGLEYPADISDRVLGLMRRSVQFPDGEYLAQSTCKETKGEPVMMEAILACEHTPAGWVWVQLSPSTKEQIGSLLERWNVPIDEWVYCGFSQDSDQ